MNPLITFYIAIAIFFAFCLYEDYRNPNFLRLNLTFKEKIDRLVVPFLITISIFFAIAIVISLVIGKPDIAWFCGGAIFVLFWIGCQIEESKKENARRERLAAWAKSRGWTYDPNCYKKSIFHRDRNPNPNLKYLDLFKRFKQGSNRYIFDIFRGRWDRYSADAFTFHYEIRHDKSTSHYYFGVVLIHIEEYFPRLTIKPRDLFSFGGISFESVMFDKEFTVHCQDKRFAYDFCHPKAMEYLLEQGRGMDIELKDNVLAIFIDEKELNIEDLEESLNRLVKLRKLMPNYLYRS